MPEPGQTPQPQIKQGSGPEALPWGEAAQINDAIGLIPPEEDDETYQPTGPQEEFLFSPTDRPTEPFTAGLPFGAGPGDVPRAHETDRQFVQRVAGELKQDPNTPKNLKQFADRALQGM